MKAKGIAASLSLILVLTGLGACSGSETANVADGKQSSSKTSARPVMSKSEAASKYEEIVEPSNDAAEKYNLAFYTFDMGMIADEAEKASDAASTAADKLDKLEWPKSVKEDVSSVIDALNHDSAVYKRIAAIDSFGDLQQSTLDFSTDTSSKDIREKLGLPESQAAMPPFSVTGIDVGPLEYGNRTITVTVMNNMPAPLRAFGIDLSIKDASGNTLTTTTAWQDGANAETGTTVPATAYIEDVPAGSIVETVSGNVVDASTSTAYPFDFGTEQPTGIVQ